MGSSTEEEDFGLDPAFEEHAVPPYPWLTRETWWKFRGMTRFLQDPFSDEANEAWLRDAHLRWRAINGLDIHLDNTGPISAWRDELRHLKSRYSEEDLLRHRQERRRRRAQQIKALKG